MTGFGGSVQTRDPSPEGGPGATLRRFFRAAEKEIRGRSLGLVCMVQFRGLPFGGISAENHCPVK